MTKARLFNIASPVRLTRRLAAFCMFCSLATTLVCCSGSPSPEGAAEAEAMAVAQACYDRLIEGDYDAFLAFRHDIDKIPADMRSQIADAMKMYIATEEKMHGGIKRVKATRAEMDSTLNVMKVYMMLSYGNGTQEEVVLPMVSTADGQWRMK